jgi:hypothetical protein
MAAEIWHLEDKLFSQKQIAEKLINNIILKGELKYILLITPARNPSASINPIR